MYVAAAKHSFQVQTHVVGDAAFDIVVSALRQANDQIRLAPCRFTLMHLFLPSRAGLKAMKRMGILATVQDLPVLLGDNMTKWWGQQRAERGIPVRDILDAGLLAGRGTDAPVVHRVHCGHLGG